MYDVMSINKFDSRALLRALQSEGQKRFGNQPLTRATFDTLLDALPDTPEQASEEAPGREFHGMRYPTDLTLRLFALTDAHALEALPEEHGESLASGALESGATYNSFEDVVRTKKFLSGIRDVLAEYPANKRMHIVDAGCGAVPLLGLYAALARPESAVTLIEYNRHSARIARSILDAHHLTNVQLVVADAIQYIPHAPIDVLLSETITQGLMGESFPDVCAHFLPHLAMGGSIVPKRIHISCALVEAGSVHHPPKKIRLTHEWVEVLAPNEFLAHVTAMHTYTCDSADMPKNVTFAIPIDDVSDSCDIWILTEVDITDTTTLTFWESYITFPRMVARAPIAAAKKAGKATLFVEYAVGKGFYELGSEVRVAY